MSTATTTKRKRTRKPKSTTATAPVAAETPTVAAESEPATAPEPEHPAIARAERLIRQLGQLGVEPDPRMVLTEAAWGVLQRLVRDGTLEEALVRDLIYEAQAAVLSDMLVWVEEQRATARRQQAQQLRTPGGPRSALAQAIERQVQAGRMTPSGIALP